ncbi:cytohesin-1-like [Actinia tenebrosa]|uniref:Cytohesin-1-like n=1 Tax=Actinia tenebrosa TaxID=6105 RepID=A0A6P8I142_ACTTE|nr:cytohesin-1-like [Actinia tenebrosa]
MSSMMTAERNDTSAISGLTAKEQALLNDIRQRKSQLLVEIEQLKADIAQVTDELDSLDQQDLIGSKEDMKIKQKTIGRKKFNLHPEKGIEYLVSNGLLNKVPEDVADFLYSGEGLNKTQIGNYLGENKEFNLEVFDKFVVLHKFEGKLLVNALREFLWSFRLPGEAQKIDRMMEGFAKQYCKDNPGLFTSTDTCYVLSFSIILLNTSLHNPSVKDKPTVEKFILMNKGINCGADLDEDFLVTLYESIKNEAFKIPEDDGNDITQTFFNPDREGVLVKEGGLHKTWRKRYFILKDNCLYYFKNVGDREPRGIIPLENLQVREVNDARRKYCFEIYSADNASGLIKACKTDSEGKVVEGHHDVYRICAFSEEERETWIKCIKASMIFDPFYDMLQTRKKKVTQAVYS